MWCTWNVYKCTWTVCICNACICTCNYSDRPTPILIDKFRILSLIHLFFFFFCFLFHFQFKILTDFYFDTQTDFFLSIFVLQWNFPCAASEGLANRRSWETRGRTEESSKLRLWSKRWPTTGRHNLRSPSADFRKTSNKSNPAFGTTTSNIRSKESNKETKTFKIVLIISLYKRESELISRPKSSHLFNKDIEDLYFSLSCLLEIWNIDDMKARTSTMVVIFI